MEFEVIGRISSIEVIAVGSRIRILSYLEKTYGRGRWRKLKGVATVQLRNGALRKVESTGSRLMGLADAT